MDTPWSYAGCLARGKAGVGIDVASQELSGQHEQVDAMVCDPTTCAEDGEGNLKDSVHCFAPGEEISGWPTMTSSGNGITFNNAADGRLRRGNFSDFLSFLQKYPPGGESNSHDYRNFCKPALISFLEERNDNILKAAFQQIAELDAFYRSEVTVLTGKHEQQLGKLSRDLEKVFKELSAAQAQVISLRSSLDTALSEIQDRKNAVQILQGKLEEESRQRQELSKRRDSIQKDMTAQRADFEAKLRQGKEAREAKEREVHQLKSVIEQMQNDLRNMEATKVQSTIECQKLKAHLAAIEQKSAQESDEWLLIC